MSNRALVLIDLENEWQDENSEYYAGNLSGLIKSINQLIDYCREEGYKIIFIRHVEKGSDDSFVESSPNTKIISEVHKQDEDVLVTKYKISPFYNTKLEEELKKIGEVVVAGILTNLCVRSFVNDAYDRNIPTKLISDCCVAFDKETHEFTLKDIRATRPEIEILSLEEFIK
jgi:ureidoacrylate peracid hydrolase